MLEHDALEWEFDALRLHELTGGRALSVLGWAFFQRHHARASLHVPAARVDASLRSLEGAYRDVPYHSAAHAACVAHGVHWLLSHPALRGVADGALDVLTALLAACLHDADHNGRNNAFHIASGSPLAVRYNDHSVLENHHLATGFALLAAPECGLLDGLGLEARKHLRATVIGMVLATDLANNFTTINTFKTMLDDHHITQPLHADGAAAAAVLAAAAALPAAAEGLGRQSSRESTRLSVRDSLRHSFSGGRERHSSSDAAADGMSPPQQPPPPSPPPPADLGALLGEAEKLLVLKMLIKCADIGNVTKGVAVCVPWTDRVIQEFFEQGDEEKRLRLPVTPMMDREVASPPKLQLGFYNFIVRPMFEALSLLVPLDRQFDNLAAAEQHWRCKLPRDEPQPAVEPPKPRSRRSTKNDMKLGGAGAGASSGGEAEPKQEAKPRSRRPTKNDMPVGD